MCKKKILVHCQIKRSKRSYTLHFISGELAKDYAERHNVPNWYDDANLLINSPDVDAVYIATPPGSHKEYTIKAAKAGKPVYVEKLMAWNIAECQEMIAACEAVGVREPHLEIIIT